MGAYASNNWLDASPNYAKNNADKMVVCNAQPESYATAVGANALADVAMVSGDFTLSSSGDDRRLTVAAKSSVPVDATGTATHIALVDTSTSELIIVTTTTSQAITSGGSVDIPEWTIDNKTPTVL
ncbi:hypothetical protein [Kiloniella antarctica]|uniref:Uncharacterized protein n=1 Tax=Kiloniella antarctica TaxID=1550907 RepID=A0ABW5BR25_9PROT